MAWKEYIHLKATDPKYQEYKEWRAKLRIDQMPKEAKVFLSRIINDGLDLEEDMPVTLSDGQNDEADVTVPESSDVKDGNEDSD